MAENENPQGRIIDAHLHLNSTGWFTAPAFEPRLKTRRRRKNFKPLPSLYSDMALASGKPLEELFAVGSLAQNAARLVAELDEAGVDKAVLMGMDYDHTGQRLAQDHWTQLSQLAGLEKDYPGRFLLFCGLDPRRGPEKSVPFLERAVRELGCVGLKLTPHWGFYPDDRELMYPLYEKCVELGLPVTSNCSAIGSSHVAARYCHPLLFEQVAHDFPEMNISLAHAGVPYHTEYALSLAMQKPNIYMDLGDWNMKESRYWPERTLTFLRRAMDSPARRKVIFASDWPVFRGAYSEREWVEFFRAGNRELGVEFAPAELELFFSQNAQDYLDLDLF